MYFSRICYANGWLHVTNKTIYFHRGSILPMSQYYFQCFMASCCSSTFDLSSFSLFGIFTFIFWTVFFNVFRLIFLISTYLFIIYSFFWTIIYSLYFQPDLWGAFTREGFTCFIYAIAYFISIAEHFVRKFSPEFSVLFLYKFLTPIFQCQCLVTWDKHRPIFCGGFW